MSFAQQSDNNWTYENLTEWSKHFPCANGLCQSPIDINTGETIFEHHSPMIFSSKYDSDILFTLNNNGQQIAAKLCQENDEQISDELWLTGSNLIGKHHFVNFHLHWGQDNEHGSEHEIDGRRYPAEAHFVHRNRDDGQIVVLAFLFTIADNDINNTDVLHEWGKFANVASQLVRMNDSIDAMFNLSRLMQVKNREFFRYMGSLTTPPCTEGVLWTVFLQEIPIKDESLNSLRQNIMQNVYRPIQPLNGRNVFRNYEYSKMF